MVRNVIKIARTGKKKSFKTIGTTLVTVLYLK